MELNSEGFNFQEMSCCCSLSPPSEPPHIGNWFSSYNYESPEMSFGEVAVDFVSGDVKLRKLGNFDDERNEKRGEDSAKLGRYRKSTKMVHTCDKNSSSEPDDDGDIHIQHNQNMNLMNVDSLSLPSEPLDIRNWFSSYMYESPELDTGASLNISVSGDIQLDQQDNSNKLSSQEEGNNGKHRRTCGNENVISEKDGISGLSEGRIPLESDGANDVFHTDSVSLPSEPPDIGNWFSSYVYKSPVLFTDGELEVPFVKEIQFGDCDGSAVKRSRRKANWDISNSFGTSDKTSIHHTDVFRDMMSSHSHIESDTSQGNCRVEESDKNKNDSFPILSDQIVEETQCTNHSTSGREKTVDKIEPPPLRNKTVSDLTVSKCSRGLLHRKSSSVKHSRVKANAANPVSLDTEVALLTKDPGKSSISLQGNFVFEQVDVGADKENIRSDVAKTGFISTKKDLKKIPNQDNPYFLQKQQIPAVDQNHFSITNPVQGSTIKVGSKRDAVSDVTNTQHFAEQEISGKWKCPQRSKSNLQPSMKQLRLEQWVTRA